MTGSATKQSSYAMDYLFLIGDLGGVEGTGSYDATWLMSIVFGEPKFLRKVGL